MCAQGLMKSMVAERRGSRIPAGTPATSTRRESAVVTAGEQEVRWEQGALAEVCRNSDTILQALREGATQSDALLSEVLSRARAGAPDLGDALRSLHAQLVADLDLQGLGSRTGRSPVGIHGVSRPRIPQADRQVLRCPRQICDRVAFPERGADPQCAIDGVELTPDSF